MNKLLRAVFALCLAAALLLLAGCEDEKTKYPSPTDELYVNDFADAISEDDEAEILAAGTALERAVAESLKKETGAQVAAVTVKTTDGTDISEYATNLGREWALGDKEDNNGIVILLATEDREVFVAVGYGLEGDLNDAKVGNLIDTYGMPYFAENEFSSGIKSLYNAITAEVYKAYDLPVPDTLPKPAKYSSDVDAEDSAMSWLVIGVIVLICIFYMRKRGFFPIFGGFGGGFGGFSGGGFSGGGSSSGGFSGGGGSFGGGGAGRSF